MVKLIPVRWVFYDLFYRKLLTLSDEAAHASFLSDSLVRLARH